MTTFPRLPAICVAALQVTACSKASPDAKDTKAEAKTDDAKTDPEGDAEPDAKEAAAPANDAKKPDAKNAKTWTFDEGDEPPGTFRLTETGGAGTPATWQIVEDPEAPSPPNAFGITETKNGKSTYNLALAEGTSYTDVDISVMVHPGTGELDQGGGPIWRVKDENNYYIARWNPLEKNVAFYVVIDGVRETLLKAELDIPVDAWHELRVVATGTEMRCFVDDEPVMSFADARLEDAGMIGLWTKADAATLFDDLYVTSP